MRPIKVTIDVDPQKIPELVCSDYSVQVGSGTHQIAAAVAKALGIEEYLSQPDRIYELRALGVGTREHGDNLLAGAGSSSAGHVRGLSAPSL